MSSYPPAGGRMGRVRLDEAGWLNGEKTTNREILVVKTLRKV